MSQELSKCDYLCLVSIAGCETFLSALEKNLQKRKELGLTNPKILTNFLAGSHPTQKENSSEFKSKTQMNKFGNRFLAQVSERVAGFEELIDEKGTEISVPKYYQDLKLNRFRARSYFEIKDGQKIIAIGDIANGGDYGYCKTWDREKYVELIRKLISQGFKIAFVDPSTRFDIKTIKEYFCDQEIASIIFTFDQYKKLCNSEKGFFESSFISNVDLISVCTAYIGLDTGCSHLVSSIIQVSNSDCKKTKIVQLWSGAASNSNRGAFDDQVGAYTPVEWGIYDALHIVGKGEDYNSINDISVDQVFQNLTT